MLPPARQLTGKTFIIQIKKSFSKTTCGTRGKLIFLSYAEKENTIIASSNEHSRKQQKEDRKSCWKQRTQGRKKKLPLAGMLQSPKLTLQNTITRYNNFCIKQCHFAFSKQLLPTLKTSTNCYILTFFISEKISQYGWSHFL